MAVQSLFVTETEAWFYFVYFFLFFHFSFSAPPRESDGFADVGHETEVQRGVLTRGDKRQQTGSKSSPVTDTSGKKRLLFSPH